MDEDEAAARSSGAEPGRMQTSARRAAALLFGDECWLDQQHVQQGRAVLSIMCSMQF
jgi:hypothetical protein